MGMDTDEEELTTDDEFDVIATGHHRRPYQPHRVVPPLGDDTEEEEEDDDDGVYKPSRPGSGGSTVSLQQQQSAARGFRESYRPASGNTLDLRPATAADADAAREVASAGAGAGVATREVDLSTLSAELFSPKEYVTSPTKRVQQNLLTPAGIPDGAPVAGLEKAGVGIGIGHPTVGNLWSHRPPSRGLPPAEALHLFSNNEAAASAPPISSRPQTAVVGASHSRPFSRRSRQRPWSGPSGLSEEERNRLHRSRPPSRGRPPPETLQL